MEQLLDIIKKRMSIRAYKDQPLSEGTINSILETAKNAPTARNLQQLEYKVITNKALIKKCSDGISAALKQENPNMQMPPNASFFYSAPLLIIITGPADNQWIYSDAGLAIQNIMLYATSLDLGSCFIGMARYLDKDKGLLKELHIADGKKIAGTVICGYPNEKPASKEKKLVAEYFK
jgi:nitroreductase